MKALKTLLLYILGMAVLSSCEDILEVPDISDREVALVAPLEGAEVRQSPVTFTWNGIADADAYWVQIATPNFTNAAQVLLDSVVVLDSTFLGTRAVKALTNGEYEWRVKGLNSGFETVFSRSAFTVNAPEETPTETPETEEE
ncbi:MAG: hypothetical protein AAFX53_16135 [Bacteroidota bacterium]